MYFVQYLMAFKVKENYFMTKEKYDKKCGFVLNKLV